MLTMLEDMAAFANEKGLTFAERELLRVRGEIEPEIRAASLEDANVTSPATDEITSKTITQ